jgi:hypothetical protein
MLLRSTVSLVLLFSIVLPASANPTPPVEDGPGGRTSGGSRAVIHPALVTV